MIALFLLPTGKMCVKIYSMKKVICLLLCVIALFCSCDSGELWGSYLSEDENSSVEFAYSKVFYTLDIAKAQAEADDEDSEAVIEGWYETEGDSVVCTFRITRGDKTEKHVYTFDIDGDSLTLAGYTVDGEDKPYESEVFKK